MDVILERCCIYVSCIYHLPSTTYPFIYPDTYLVMLGDAVYSEGYEVNE